MSLKGGNSTVTTNVDPRTQGYVDQLRRAALGYAGISGPAGASGSAGTGYGGMFSPGGFVNRTTGAASQGYQPIAPQYPPELLAAQQQLGNYAQAGQTGLSALTGGANPFMNQYLNQLNPTFDFLRQNAMNDADARATQMGAFGGSRGDIFAGTAVGDINRAQAGLNYNAFNDSQARALAAAQLGYGAGPAAAFLPQQYASGQLGLLNQGLGPYGQTQTQHTQADPFSQLLGLGLMFVPGGPLAGVLGRGVAGGVGTQVLGNLGGSGGYG